jgi:hypothetical protein
VTSAGASQESRSSRRHRHNVTLVGSLAMRVTLTGQRGTT